MAFRQGDNTAPFRKRKVQRGGGQKRRRRELHDFEELKQEFFRIKSSENKVKKQIWALVYKLTAVKENEAEGERRTEADQLVKQTLGFLRWWEDGQESEVEERGKGRQEDKQGEKERKSPQMLTLTQRFPHTPIRATGSMACPDTEYSSAVKGRLSATVLPQFRQLFRQLQSQGGTSYNGKETGRRQAWFLGELGTELNYGFTGFTVPLRPAPGGCEWLWDLGRELYRSTGVPLNGDFRLVAFIPRYEPGASCAEHQDKEAPMRHSWIVSVSFGAKASFTFSGNKGTDEQTVELQELDVLGMSRWLWHRAGRAEGERWNVTFRCWQHAWDPWRDLTMLAEEIRLEQLRKEVHARKR
jgi:hypothetical protein